MGLFFSLSPEIIGLTQVLKPTKIPLPKLSVETKSITKAPTISRASIETMSLLPALLNFSLHPATKLSLSKPHFLSLKPSPNFPSTKLSLSKPHFLSLKPSPNFPSTSSAATTVKFSLHHLQYNAIDDEAEELVIGDCLVFEEGIFEDPYLNEALNSPPAPAPSSGKQVQRGGNVIEIEPENLIPEKWKEAQAEINVTKKERRKMKQALEFGKRLERKREGMRPIGMSADEYRTVKLAELKPLVLDNPTFLVEEKVQKDTDGSDSDGDDGGVGSGRVAPRNPKLAVYGASLDDISEFLNSGRYDPEAAKKPEGARNKLFTKEEKELMNKRVPDLATATTGKWHPLHTVASAGEFYLVDALLKHNVDINATDKDGLTALHKAVLGRKQAIFNYLLRESANPFIHDREGATLMHYAVRTASSPMIKILLLYNVDINLQDNDGWTPLHLAVQSCRTDIVRLLLIKGAAKTLKNQDGLTPLDLCLYSGRDTRTYELIKLLKQLPGPRRRAIEPYQLTT